MEKTLAKATDLAAGDLPMARQRLLGLVAGFPDRLDLREQPAQLSRQ